MIISPSLLSADFTNLTEQLKEVEESQATWIHFDVMDGHFVKNLTFGPDILNAVKRCSNLFRDVHLMITDPAEFIDPFIQAGAELITFHLDAVNDTDKAKKIISELHRKGVKAGITLRPSVPLEHFLPFLDQVDLVLVMSVEPGFGGQSFMPDALDRIRWLKQQRETMNVHYLIEVDGGVNQETGKQCLEAGADVLVAGSYVFKHNIKEAVQSLWVE